MKKVVWIFITLAALIVVGLVIAASKVEIDEEIITQFQNKNDSSSKLDDYGIPIGAEILTTYSVEDDGLTVGAESHFILKDGTVRLYEYYVSNVEFEKADSKSIRQINRTAGFDDNYLHTVSGGNDTFKKANSPISQAISKDEKEYFGNLADYYAAYIKYDELYLVWINPDLYYGGEVVIGEYPKYGFKALFPIVNKDSKEVVAYINHDDPLFYKDKLAVVRRDALYVAPVGESLEKIGPDGSSRRFAHLIDREDNTVYFIDESKVSVLNGETEISSFSFDDESEGGSIRRSLSLTPIDGVLLFHDFRLLELEARNHYKLIDIEEKTVEEIGSEEAWYREVGCDGPCPITPSILAVSKHGTVAVSNFQENSETVVYVKNETSNVWERRTIPDEGFLRAGDVKISPNGLYLASTHQSSYSSGFCSSGVTLKTLLRLVNMETLEVIKIDDTRVNQSGFDSIEWKDDSSGFSYSKKNYKLEFNPAVNSCLDDELLNPLDDLIHYEIG